MVFIISKGASHVVGTVASLGMCVPIVLIWRLGILFEISFCLWLLFHSCAILTEWGSVCQIVHFGTLVPASSPPFPFLLIAVMFLLDIGGRGCSVLLGRSLFSSRVFLSSSSSAHLALSYSVSSSLANLSCFAALAFFSRVCFIYFL